MHNIVLFSAGQIPTVFIEGSTLCLPPYAPPPSAPAIVAELKVTTIMTLDGTYNRSVTASAIVSKTYEILVTFANNTEYLPPSNILVFQTYTVVVEEPIPSNIRELLCLPFPRQSYDFMRCIVKNRIEFNGISDEIRRLSENLNNTYTVSVPMTIDGYPGREPSFNNTFNYSAVNIDAVTMQIQTDVSDTENYQLLRDADIVASKRGLSLLVESGTSDFINDTEIVLPSPPGIPPVQPGQLHPPSLPPPPLSPPNEGGKVNFGLAVCIPILVIFLMLALYFRKVLKQTINRILLSRLQVAPVDVDELDAEDTELDAEDTELQENYEQVPSSYFGASSRFATGSRFNTHRSRFM
ncbi:hypothetical protein EPVG_00269 [Emiliania huxleyi virus 201]|nr:hypothetical protein ELVG_00034 [Emiliania huxleyi virus 203]AEP15440.1 hypothetical protein EQVG_00030 [Emiliania huxleyi virus 207]AEP16075.1 hypothetical protein ERVG_00199 [Emiliania huxleyi virus 208]AET98156.1 hypothetical protein EPVG_00269 [Emiliania huxleyi virus 201]